MQKSSEIQEIAGQRQDKRNLIKCLMNSGLETESCLSFEAKEVKSLTVGLKLHVQKLLRMYF